MTYKVEGVEYLDSFEQQVYKAVKQLNGARRTTNNSQIASVTGLSRNTISKVTRELWARDFIRNAGKGAAYHWRVTGKTWGR